MRRENTGYDVFPKIVPTERESTISIRPLFGHSRFDESSDYRVTIFPAEGYPGQTGWVTHSSRIVRPKQGMLSVSHEFGSEQEYVFRLERMANDEPKSTLEFRLYALEADLFSCFPFKGDLHMHSNYSDGLESPAYVASACRRIGFDFMAVTDHRLYAPSLEAIDAFKNVDIDLRIYPGEEVHAPENPVHIINFGGDFSVNELFKTDAYTAEVKAIQERLTDVPEGVDSYSYASCVWCYDKIRAGGGLGIFCHPYWFTWRGYDVPGSLTDMIFDRQPFDALELLGGYQLREAESNTLQVARYNEERANGKIIPIVGVSDSHGTIGSDLFGWFYTIAFAPNPDLRSIVDAVKDLKSVAVEALPGEIVRSYGPFRLVRYSQYLLREIFPLHDELCVEEGRLMQAHVAGDEKASTILGEYKGRTAALYAHLWGA
jgi:hypothetical protein